MHTYNKDINQLSCGYKPSGVYSHSLITQGVVTKVSIPSRFTHSGIVSPTPDRFLIFKVVHLLDWLPIKLGGTSLSIVVGKRDRIISFSRIFVQK